MFLAIILLFMVACSNINIDDFNEEFISKVKDGDFIDAVLFYEEETDGLSKKKLEELRESIGTELEVYLKQLNENMVDDLNKSELMLDTIEFIQKMELESYLNVVLDEYKDGVKLIISKIENEEGKSLAEQEKEQAKKEEEEQAKKEKEKKEEEEQAKKEQEDKVKKEEEKEQEAQAKKVKEKKENEATETNSQQQAVGMAQNYISFTAFSKSGLIEQLEFEGFDNEDASYAVEQINVDWKEQAAKAAGNYLDMTSFSRSGLIEQLKFEGYTDEQATYGVDQVGL